MTKKVSFVSYEIETRNVLVLLLDAVSATPLFVVVVVVVVVVCFRPGTN